MNAPNKARSQPEPPPTQPSETAAPRRRRVLVFNFFSGVKDRGIPIYTRGLIEALNRIDTEVIELRCPLFLRAAPSWFLNTLFVLLEQLAAPLIRAARRCGVTIYPYNSSGVIDALLGKSIVVVHDLIPNARRQKGLSARYIRITQAVHRWLRRPICAASAHTLHCLQRLKAFSRSPLHLWSNPFYTVAAAAEHSAAEAAQRTPGPRRRVLLCTGMGPHKDYAGAVRLFRKSPALAEAELRIVGFGDDAQLAMRRIRRLPEDLRARITVLPRLSLREISREYQQSDLVWVHSRKEGYGRSAVEARIHQRRVLASDITAFRRMKWLGLTLYRAADFDARAAQALAAPVEPFCYNMLEDFHRLLEESVRNVLVQHEARPAGPVRDEEHSAGEALTPRQQPTAQVIVLNCLHRDPLLKRETRRDAR